MKQKYKDGRVDEMGWGLFGNMLLVPIEENPRPVMPWVPDEIVNDPKVRAEYIPRITHAVPAADPQLSTPNSVWFDHDRLVKGFKEIAKDWQGLTLLGNAHTHPQGNPARPSEHDLTADLAWLEFNHKPWGIFGIMSIQDEITLKGYWYLLKAGEKAYTSLKVLFPIQGE